MFKKFWEEEKERDLIGFAGICSYDIKDINTKIHFGLVNNTIPIWEWRPWSGLFIKGPRIYFGLEFYEGSAKFIIEGKVSLENRSYNISMGGIGHFGSIFLKIYFTYLPLTNDEKRVFIGIMLGIHSKKERQ